MNRHVRQQCTNLLMALSAVSLVSLSGAARADNASEAKPLESPSSLTGNATFVSDYVWRGVSQTFGLPALQAGVDYRHQSGLYGGFWASNVSEKWVPGANLETDYYVGYKTEVAPRLAVDVNLLYVYYPGGDYRKALDGRTFQSSKPNTLEPSITLTYGWASLKYARTLSKFYGWNTNNSAPGVFSTEDSRAGVTGSTTGSQNIEFTANFDVGNNWSVSAQLGKQFIAHSTGLNWTYAKVGVTKVLYDHWTVNLSVSGTSNPKAFRNYAALTGSGDTDDVASTKAILAIGRTF